MTVHNSNLLMVMDGEVVGDIAVKGKGGRLLYDGSAHTPLSVSMPLNPRRHRDDALIPWLRNLLPDRESVLMQWRRTFGVRSMNPIELLNHVSGTALTERRNMSPTSMSDTGRAGRQAVASDNLS
jgi:HipA-like protein